MKHRQNKKRKGWDTVIEALAVLKNQKLKTQIRAKVMILKFVYINGYLNYCALLKNYQQKQ